MIQIEVANDVCGPKANLTLIFVVDDEPMLLELAKLLLAPHGYEVHCFRDPAGALEAFKAASDKPALVITDYAMQTMNGLQLMKACREIRPGQKVLMLSGTVSESFIGQSSMLPDAFLEKPFRNQELIKLTQTLLGKV